MAAEHWPASFVIGVTRADGRPLEIAGSDADRRNEWIEVEGLGRPEVQPPSLYEAQLARRLGR